MHVDASGRAELTKHMRFLSVKTVGAWRNGGPAGSATLELELYPAVP